MPQPQDAQPLVSCVMIFLNGERFIAEAIESVLGQTYRNWELILVDDGTTDGAAAIARDYACAHPGRIRVIAHSGGANLGMSASRNAGVRAARGALVTFLDADDVWLPERLEAHVELLERHPAAAMAMGPMLMWSSWSRERTPWWRVWAGVDERYGQGLPEDVILPAPEVATHFLRRRGGGMPGICSVTIRRDALAAVGGGEDGFRRFYEDQVLFFKIMLEYPVVATGRLLDYYRQHPDSTSAVEGVRAGDVATRPVFLDWLRGWIEARRIADPGLRAALADEIAAAAEPAGGDGLRSRGELADRWRAESRLAAIWLLGPRLYNRLRLRFGREPVAWEAKAPRAPSQPLPARLTNWDGALRGADGDGRLATAARRSSTG